MTIAWTPEQIAILLADPHGDIAELTERVNAVRGTRRTWAAVETKMRKLRTPHEPRVKAPKPKQARRAGQGYPAADDFQRMGVGKCNPFAAPGSENFHRDREHVRNLLREGAGFTDPECRQWAMAQAERWAA